MKLVLLCIGKTNEAYLKQGIDLYQDRLQHYTSFELVVLKDVKNQGSPSRLMELEAQAYLQYLQDDDYLVLLDENGKMVNSLELSKLLEKHRNASTRRLVFAIGGAFGWGEAMKKRANITLSLSALTFSHQMIRLFLIEQLYRGFTILKGEKYHNP